ncbi:hypothetical protein K1719_006666 [Acacia pycnantha]|nr:hypothetical protein K1719_006666 [Acacia pycnantha]
MWSSNPCPWSMMSDDYIHIFPPISHTFAFCYLRINRSSLVSPNRSLLRIHRISWIQTHKNISAHIRIRILPICFLRWMKKKLQRMKLSPESQTPSVSSSLTSQDDSNNNETTEVYELQNAGELELEEVKGFMDLGFIFKKENVCARMMNVVPGLQRLSMHHNNEDKELIDASKAISIKGPYLSEARLIKRPDSQRLNLKIPCLPIFPVRFANTIFKVG